jgi:hypothetical protein
MPSPGTASRRCLDQWTITGEVTLIGEPSAPVRLAGFYTNCHDFFYASRPGSPCGPAQLVTTIADVGREGGDFSLCFDVASLCPSDGHYIYLILWADRDATHTFDSGVEWKYVIPLYDDRVFAGATDCVLFYQAHRDEQKGTFPGWNLSRGLEEYAPVETTVQTGARLANMTAWETSRALPA